jgi:hypothetical protein
MNTFPSENLLETVKKQEVEEEKLADEKTISGSDLLDSKDSVVCEGMGCGASSHSNVLLEEKAVQEPILHSQPAAEMVAEMIARGDSAKGTGGEGGKELISSQASVFQEGDAVHAGSIQTGGNGGKELMVFQEGDVVQAGNIHSEATAEKKAERDVSVDFMGCVANIKHVGDEACSTAETSDSSLPPAASLKQNEAIGSQEFCGASVKRASNSWTDEPKTLDEKIMKLYDEIRNGTEIMSWEALSKNSAVLSNWLLALGIGQDSKKFIHDSFKDRSDNITLSSFKATLKKELEISRKLMWVAQTGLLRCIAESLPPAKEESDPLSGLRILDRKQVLELVQAMHHQLAECLVQSIADSPIADVGPIAGQRNNSKFCVDPTLFKMK